MFDFNFEPDNTIQLIDRKPTVSREVKPVWYQELDLIGADKFFSYPKTETPLLWRVSNRYYYKGNKVFATHFVDSKTPPTIEICDNTVKFFEPIDLKKQNEQNKSFILKLIDSVKKTWEEGETDKFKKLVIGFSGGKDSCVLLHLMDYLNKFYDLFKDREIVIHFSNTTMEFQHTLDCVDEYKKRFKEYKWVVNNPPKKAIDNWKDIGFPTRKLRWCCSVYKESNGIPVNERDFALFVQGVRAAESIKRANYLPFDTNRQEKFFVFSPLLLFSSAEIWLYHFHYNMFVNTAYKFGLNRVGCVLCPLGFGKKSFFDRSIEKTFQDFENIVVNQYNKMDFETSQWCGQCGFGSLSKSTQKIQIGTKTKKIFPLEGVEYGNPEWLKIFKKCEEYEREGKKFKNLLTRRNYALIKALYCVNCGYCKTECKKGAISFKGGELKIDENLCQGCLDCAKHRCFAFRRQYLPLSKLKQNPDL